MIIPRESIFDLTKYLVDAKAAEPIFQEFLSKKNGVRSEQVCVIPSDIDAALLDIQPLSKQLLLEFYSNTAAEDEKSFEANMLA
jgi:hypothetical protein